VVEEFFMVITSVAALPAFQRVACEEATPDNESASCTYRTDASDSEGFGHDASAWPIAIPAVHMRGSEMQDPGRENNECSSQERRRAGRAEYDSEVLIQILRQNTNGAELPVTDAGNDLHHDSELRPAIGLMISLGLSALFWASFLGVLKLLV
jgi:hypothetical protein